MSNQPIEDNDTPTEIDFSKGVRGLHHIPPGDKVLMPASEVLKRDIEINEALKQEAAISAQPAADPGI
jgi:hypothetical protein